MSVDIVSFAARERSQYDAWYLSQPREVQDSDAALCSKHLELLLAGKTIGDQNEFWSSTIHLCVHTAADVATRLAADSEARLDQRFQAMSLLVSLSPWSKSVEQRLAGLSEILDLDPGEDPFAHIERMSLALAISANAALWPTHRARIVANVEQTAKWAGCECGNATVRKGVVRKCAEEARSVLIHRISTPPS